jgi:flagellar L-ring protein precursor FlgH
MRIAFACTTVLSALALAGCATDGSPLVERPDAWRAAMPEVDAPMPVANGSIYQNGQDIRLFENSVARRVGDTLTIRLVENMDASKSSSTSTGKNSGVSIPAPTIGGQSLPMVNIDQALKGNLRRLGTVGDTTIESERNFDGSGSSSQANSISGDITVTVAKRWPNGNLFVRGEKWIQINQGKEFVRVSGIVRSVDIGPDNTVASTKIADARITYSGTGALADANSPGLLSRFFNFSWFPF